MLNVYGVSWCPHCRRTVSFLVENHVDFSYFDIEHQSEEIEQQVIEANGGKGWVVPTLEFEGKWRPGKTYDERELRRDLSAWGLVEP
jgi:mycoredoxin